MNYDINLANRDDGSWVEGRCPYRTNPSNNPHCMGEVMRSNGIYNSTSHGSDHALRHAKKIAIKCHENGENCPFGGLEDTLRVIEKISVKDIN